MLRIPGSCLGCLVRDLREALFKADSSALDMTYDGDKNQIKAPAFLQEAFQDFQRERLDHPPQFRAKRDRWALLPRLRHAELPRKDLRSLALRCRIAVFL